MATTLTIEITGPLADIQVGDTVWVGDNGHAEERTVAGIEYEPRNDGTWGIEYFKILNPDADDEDDWDWYSPANVFHTELDALQYLLDDVTRDIADDESRLRDRKRTQHELQRRITVLTDGEGLFDAD